MEMEYFVPPDEAEKWYQYWCQERLDWYRSLGMPDDRLRLRPHDAEELSHYSSGTSDVEYRYPWGWGELEGIAQRTDFDLKRHAEASGHLANFTDPLVDCRNCKERFRLDKLDDPEVCPNCAAKGSFTEARQFNLMFKTHAGPVEEDAAVAYLRPETAQGMFVNFKNVLETSR